MNRLALALLVAVLWGGLAIANSADLYVTPQGINLSTDKIFEGTPVRIYANIGNSSGLDARGSVKFFLGSDTVQIGSDQPVAVLGGNTDVAFVDLYPPKGQHTIIVRVIPFQPADSNPNNNIASRTIWVKADADRDQIADEEDLDDDNDGIEDLEDAFPLNPTESADNDEDGIGDNEDLDDDNDGVPDSDDALPNNPDETEDLDGDGIGDNEDTDDDGDEIADDQEILQGLDPKLADSDGDGFKDGEDAFPLDPTAALDQDRDGIGDIIDTDDDGDGIKDNVDPLPLNAGPEMKLKISPLRLSGSELVFDASKSFDRDGKVAGAIWNFNGEIKKGLRVKHRFEQPGIKQITVTVYDDDGEGRRRTFDLTIFSKALAGLLAAVLLALLGLFQYIARTSKRR